MLRDFLPRYNTRFAVPADLPEPAYRPWHGKRPLDEILCFKRTRKVTRDNTVKYQWRTLQLLPSRERPSYAGVQVEVLRELTPRQLALWKAVQQAQAQGLSLREISRQLGVHRNTVRKYARSLTQPTNLPINRGVSGSFQPAINRSD